MRLNLSWVVRFKWLGESPSRAGACFVLGMSLLPMGQGQQIGSVQSHDHVSTSVLGLEVDVQFQGFSSVFGQYGGRWGSQDAVRFDSPCDVFRLGVPTPGVLGLQTIVDGSGMSFVEQFGGRFLQGPHDGLAGSWLPDAGAEESGSYPVTSYLDCFSGDSYGLPGLDFDGYMNCPDVMAAAAICVGTPTGGTDWVRTGLLDFSFDQSGEGVTGSVAFPEVVALLILYESDEQKILSLSVVCSGILLTPQIVLTAAHCFGNGVREALGLAWDEWAVSATQVAVDANAVFVGHVVSASGVDGTIVRIVDEHFPSANELSKIGDLAIAVLAAPISIDWPPERVLPYGLIDSLDWDPVGPSPAVVVGFGVRDSKGSRGHRLYARIDVNNCAPGSKWVEVCHADMDFVSPPNPGEVMQSVKDTCKFDSGGPLFAPGPHREAPLVLVGITRRSLLSTGQCGRGGVYTRVDREPVYQWIRTVVSMYADE